MTPPASDRPTARRSTVRVLVIDDRDRLLMFRDSDPGTGAAWWITPGGGIDPGETELDAVIREIAEETGYAVPLGSVLGPLAGRRVLHGYSDRIVDQHDTFYAIRVPSFTVDVAGHTEEEQVTLQGHRWWSRSDLVATDELIWPVLVLDLWDLLDQPDRWPLALPDVEESSVPLDPPV